MPVLPLVASSSVLPAWNRPLRRPWVTIFPAARSLTEPPGLYHSALPKSATPGRSAVTASRRNHGVLPMLCSRLWPRLAAPFPASLAAGEVGGANVRASWDEL